MTLYDLSKEFEALYSLANESECEELEELYNELQGSLNDKLDNTAKVLKQLQADSDAIKSEEARLKSRRQAIENNVELLKDLMLMALKSSGEAKTKTTLFSFSFLTSTSVSAPDVNLLPKKFVRVTVTKSADKKAIKEAIDGGKKVKGAEIVYNDSIQIK